MSDIMLECPHCKGIVIVAPNEINCAIFRHGMLKSTRQQVPPHAPKELCEHLIATNAVDGCCRPFKMELTNVSETDSSGNIIHSKVWKAVECDYI